MADLLRYLPLAHFAICAGIFWACLCRLNSDVCKHYKFARLRYSVVLGGAVAFGGQALFFGTSPSVADTLFAASMLIYLLINVPRWIHPDQHIDPHSGETRYCEGD